MHTSNDRNVSIVFRPQDVGKHCAGVEALLIPSIPTHKLIFTASRDSTVKRWDVSGPEPALEASFEGHADWVNDLALIGDLLITCSNDHTVRLWRAGSENGQLLHTLAAHSDYVTRLAAAPSRRLVVSAGLRSEVFSYDVEGGQHTRLQLRNNGDDEPLEGRNDPCSVYSLALSPSARLLAAGTSESLVRLLDPRSGKGICRLRGHRDVVRALAVSPCGTQLLSGASDGAIKLWDVGMQRCVQTFTVHSDSVWSLVWPADDASVYSAGRDGAIFRTNTQTSTSDLLAREEGPVRALAVDLEARPAPSGGFTSGQVGLWAATQASHVNMWLAPSPGRQLHEVASVPPPRASNAEAVTAVAAAAAAAVAASTTSSALAAAAAAAATVNEPAADRPAGTPQLLSGRSFPALRVTPAAKTSCKEPLVRKPVATIAGIPAIVAHEVLPDRRQVLVKDARGHVALWDVLLGIQVAAYGKVDFDSKRREMLDVRSLSPAVPPWFTSDHRLGCLSITMSPPSAFGAEEYAVKLGYRNAPPDHRVNLGKLVLECAFAKWRYMLGQNLAQSCCISPGGSSGGSSVPSLRNSGGGSGGLVAAPHPGHADSGGSGPDSCGSCDSEGRPYYHDLWPKYWQCGSLPAVISSKVDGQRWRRRLTEFDGSETEPEEIPRWVGDVVLRSASVAPLEAKITFYLLPTKGSNLPTLTITRLQAPRILEVRRVAKYCCEKLQEFGIRLETLPSYRRRVPLAPLECPGPVRSRAVLQLPPVLELTCNGVAVPYDLNLAAVRQLLWQASDDLTFHYGVRDPARPAPQPTLGPSG